MVQYGRQAEPGEKYGATITAGACVELWAQTPEQAAVRLAELSDNIRYSIIDINYRYHTDTAPDHEDDSYRLVDVMFLSQEELLVTFAVHLDALGDSRPECGWVSDQAG